MTDAELLHEYAVRVAPVCGRPPQIQEIDPSLDYLGKEIRVACWQRHAIGWLCEREPQMEIRFRAQAPVEIWLPCARKHVYGPTLDLALLAAVEALGKGVRDA